MTTSTTEATTQERVAAVAASLDLPQGRVARRAAGWSSRATVAVPPDEPARPPDPLCGTTDPEHRRAAVSTVRITGPAGCRLLADTTMTDTRRRGTTRWRLAAPCAARREGGEMSQLTLVLALILAGVLALFGAQNTEAVTLHFLWLTARAMPLSLAILGGAVIGAVLSLLVGVPGRVRRAVTAGDLTRHSARQATQIAHLQASAADAAARDEAAQR